MGHKLRKQLKGRDLYNKNSTSYPKDTNKADNPYLGKDDKWYWFDPMEEAHGPYDSEVEASDHCDIWMAGYKMAQAEANN